MPKLKPYSFMVKPKTVVPHDFIMEMFELYQKDRRIKRDDLAGKLNMTPTSVSKKKARGSESFTLEDFKNWVKALNIPEESAADAVYRFLMQ